MIAAQLLIAALTLLLAGPALYEGRARSGRYFLAPSLVQLMKELNARHPRRSKRSDGWIGDASHAARKSEHNPAWTAPGRLRGVVRAVDVTNDGIDVTDLIREAIQDPRTWYVISRGYIYSRTHRWAKRRYTGANRHDHHVHLSILTTTAAAFSTVAWYGRQVVARVVGRQISARAVRRELRAVAAGRPTGTTSRDVLLTQKMLNRRRRQRAGRDAELITEDGIAGRQFLAACEKFETSEGFRHADGILSTRGLVVLVAAARPKRPVKVVK